MEWHSISGREWLERLADDTRLRWIQWIGARLIDLQDIYCRFVTLWLYIVGSTNVATSFSPLLLFYYPGRLEDGLLGGGGSSKRNADTLGMGTGKRSGIMWNNFSGHHAFTTGRGGGIGVGGRGNDSVPFMSSSGAGGGGGVGKASGRPKGPSQTLKVSLRPIMRIIIYAVM